MLLSWRRRCILLTFAKCYSAAFPFVMGIFLKSWTIYGEFLFCMISYRNEEVEKKFLGKISSMHHHLIASPYITCILKFMHTRVDRFLNPDLRTPSALYPGNSKSFNPSISIVTWKGALQLEGVNSLGNNKQIGGNAMLPLSTTGEWQKLPASFWNQPVINNCSHSYVHFYSTSITQWVGLVVSRWHKFHDNIDITLPNWNVYPMYVDI